MTTYRLNIVKKIKLYSDGACSPNPGVGGYGSIFVYGDLRKEFSKGYKLTTNNRMELLGLIEPLEHLKEPCEVLAVTDSQYVANAINQGWIKGWIKRGWKIASGEPVKNQDLWNRLVKIMNKHSLTIKWVRGHDGHIENEQCDQLAVNARKNYKLVEDKGYKND